MPLRQVKANSVAGAKFLDAMSNPARIKVLCLLVEHEWAVGDLSESVGLSQSAISQHLAKLRAADLVSTRRDAQTVYYRCDNPTVMKVLETLAVLFGASFRIRER